jgi:hypothetical protein
MVHIVPPAGWEPSPPPVQTPSSFDQVALPPLDHVAEIPLSLDFEPSERTFVGGLLGQKWLLWGVAPLATLAASLFLVWVLFSRPKPEPAAIETEPPATAVAGAVAERLPKSPKPEKPQDVAQRPPADRSPASTEPPSVAVDVQAATGKPSGSSGPEPRTVAKRETIQPLPSAQSSRPGDVKPPEGDPFSAVAEAANNAAKPGAPIEARKAPPAHIDVARRLADPIARLELTDVPLAKGVDLLAALGALPVTMDADALAQLGLTPRDPISLEVRSTTIGEALQAAVAQRGLAVNAENGQVFIGPPAEYREALRKVRYTVSDLTGDDKAAAAELAALARKLVAPESWQGGSGRGTIESDGDALVVVQSGDVHRQVLVFCEKLRNARHKSLRSRDDPQRFTLATRRDQARGMLDRPVTANFHEPAPLAKILAFLAEAAAADILVDRAALAAAETSDRVEATVTAKQRALGPVLAELLRPLGLVYRVVGPAIIQVTTTEAAAERLDIEFYPVGAWLAKGISGPHLAERLKARVAATTWSDVGGPGEVYFDPPSQCLIVLQSQPAQVAIEDLLAAGPQARTEEKR